MSLGGLATVFGMWWVYFDQQSGQWLTDNRVAFVWGYGHLLVFGAVASVGAGLAVLVDQASGTTHISALAAGCAMATPVAVFLAVVWYLHIRPGHPSGTIAVMFLGAAGLVLLAPLTGLTAPVIGAVMVALVVGYTHATRTGLPAG